MRVLAIDVGGFTQDILLYDSTLKPENCFKLVMPSPTIIVAEKIAAATTARRAVYFDGVNMGGGPSRSAIEKHLNAGLEVYATPEAAVTFDDDLTKVKNMGVKILKSSDLPAPKAVKIEARDIDLSAINTAFASFGVRTKYDAVAVAVLDHGKAPPGESDRLFRFNWLSKMITMDRNVSHLAWFQGEIPRFLTRMKAAAVSVARGTEVMVMDTPVAAALGSLADHEVERHRRRVVVNIGNFHTIVFHLDGKSVLGFLEHHTGLLSRASLEELVGRLVAGKVSNREIFESDGHGCLVFESRKTLPFLSITGPRRDLMAGSEMKPYFPAPFGDMMMTGCWGLVRAYREKVGSHG